MLQVSLLGEKKEEVGGCCQLFYEVYKKFDRFIHLTVSGKLNKVSSHRDLSFQLLINSVLP